MEGLQADVTRLRQEQAERDLTLQSGFAGVRAVAARPAADPGAMSAVVTAFTGLGYALSARALLLLALTGAFVLAVLVLTTKSVLGLGVLVVYVLFTVVPVTILEIRKTRV